MKKSMIIILILLCLLAINCNEETKEISGHQSKTMDIIKEKYGLNSLVKWKSVNSVLTEVTVSFEWDSVGEEIVSNLEELVRESISQSFDSEPKVTVIQIIHFDKNDPLHNCPPPEGTQNS